ncbi:MAG TPA: histidinol-phosphate transaminase [Clostridiales bacterium]|nr:histidinol-phosphate transaminase [Clostridiales bacterium]
MSKYWSERVKLLEPYVPGEQPKDKKYIKLNTNENPYPPSPKVLDAIIKSADESLRLYPDPDCIELRKAISSYYKLNEKQVFPGNGSDELLAFSFMAFFNPGDPILFPDITYSFYPVYCSMFNIDYKLIPLDKELSIPIDRFFAKNGGIIFPNPNAPTGKYLPVEAIRNILEHNCDNVVIVDEAYIDFGGDSVIGLIDEYPNLLIIQTFSKSRSLAGLRLGFALGNENLIDALNMIKNSINSYTIDRLAIKAGIEAIKDEDYFQTTKRRIISTRERVTEALKNMGFRVVDSKANFIFITHPDKEAEWLFISLKEKGVLVRYFKKPGIDNFLRVSIGSEEEMEVFLTIIQGLVL